jgi:hypothetical protein
MRRLFIVALGVLVLGLGAGLGIHLVRRIARHLPDPAAVATQIREIARLETLEVSLYKKITFAPDPSPADSFWGDVLGWARHILNAPKGKAIVFADVRLGLDLDKLGSDKIKVAGRTVYLILPPLKTTVVIKPGETEVIDSNLDSTETAQLLELARMAFEREVASSPTLKQKARSSAERAIRSLLVILGFEEIRFVDALPGIS